MKNVIYTFYNILVDNLNRYNKNYYFYYENYLYVFYLVLNDINLVNDIYYNAKSNDNNFHEIILNKDGNLFTLVDSNNYALLKIDGIYKYEIKFEEFKYFPINKEPHNWGKLWGDKLDYYEIQLRELGYNYQTVLNSYGFFAGIAENAILYYNLSINEFNEEKVVGIVHNRMKYPCLQIDYYNPLDLVIDYNVRDISEYIKSYIISDRFDIENIIELINKLNINTLMFNILYSRLLFPTFYFDVLDNIILEDKKDSDIVPILNNVDEYINTLKEIYLIYNKKYNMFRIEWLIKNVEN